MGAARLRHIRHRRLRGIARNRLRKLERAIANAGIDPRTKLVSQTCTFQNAVNEVTVANEDTLPNGTRIIFANDADDIALGLTEATIYYLREAGVNQYTLHFNAADAIAGTSNAVIIDDGTGTTIGYILPAI